MIAITILPYETQYVQAIRHKNKIKIIKAFDDFDSIWNALKNKDYDQIFDVLQEVVAFTKRKSEEYYFVIPDTAFQINTIPYEYKTETNENDIDFLQSNNINVKENYFAFPASLHTSSEWEKSYYTINRESIDVLIRAAEDLNMIIKSIEPLSIALLRYIRQWKKQAYFLEMNEDNFDLIFFNPILGLYKYQMDFNVNNVNFNKFNASDIAEKIETELQIVHSYFLNQLKGFINPEKDVYVIAPQKIRKSLKYKSEIHNFVDIDSIDISEFVEKNDSYFYIGIGCLLQTLQTEELYKLSPYFHINNANILPHAVVNQNQLIQNKLEIKKNLRIFSVALICFLGIELGCIYHFDSVSIPDKLKNDFEVASAQVKILEAQEKTIKDASTKSEKPVQIMQNLLSVKPDNANLGFTDLEIAAQDNKKTTTPWIKLSLISDDSLKIREYVDKITDNEDFGPVNITKIDNNQNGAKTAEIIILRPGQELNQNPKDNKNKTEAQKAREKENVKK